MNRLKLIVAGVMAFGVAACDSETATSDAPAGAQTQAEVLPAGLVLDQAPAGAQDVKSARANATDGQAVVVRGVVAGRADPIAANRAVFTLLDASVPTCDKTEGDTCETPWDACCEPADQIAANSVTVQVVDGEGKPLRTGLAGVGELAPLKHVTVVGTFKPSPDGKSAVVNATGLAVE